MEPSKVERLPPVTIEFLRIVNGVEAARLCCKDCNAVHAMSWDYLGLPDNTPFPPPEGFWTCSLCGGKHVTAEPEWPLRWTHADETPVEQSAAPTPSSTATANTEDTASSLRSRLDAIMSRFDKTSTKPGLLT